MSLLQAIILGIIQGITEFFPVSSSAHLHLARSLLHIETKDVLFDLIGHLGSLLAIGIVLRKEIIQVLKSPKSILEYFVALLPLIPAYFLLKPYLLKFSEIRYLGYFFLVSSAFILFSSWKKKTPAERKFQDVLFIGSMQAMALFPGISRSGFTISAAKLRGFDPKEAVRFSFILALPTIVGGFLMESVKASISLKELFQLPYLTCFFTSFIFGFLSLRFLFKIVKNGKISFFGWYLLLLGITCIWFYG